MTYAETDRINERIKNVFENVFTKDVDRDYLNEQLKNTMKAPNDWLVQEPKDYDYLIARD